MAMFWTKASTVTFVLCHLSGLLVATSFAATTAPHIVFILVDDWGHTDVGYHNKEWDDNLRTPNLDHLASEARF